MAMGWVCFADGIATVYDELGRRRTQKNCEELAGYGFNGFVTKCHGFYYVYNPMGVIIKQNIIEREFLMERFNWHDDCLQVR